MLRAGTDRAGEGEIVDIEGKLEAWFDKHRATIAVVRPDRFVFGAAGEGGAAQIEAELRAALRT